MAGTYSFYEKRGKAVVTYLVRSPHACMQEPWVKHCPACREEHEIRRKHNETMEANDREKQRKK